MRLTRLTLKDFRNFTALDLEFHPAFNFIYGKNAQGKTNLIEAVHLVSQLKSFRTADKAELIRKGAEMAQVCATVSRDDLRWDMAVSLTRDTREVSVNGKRPKTRASYFAVLPMILFEPRHIYLFRDSPAVRRQFLNRALFLMDAGFPDTLADYDKITAQKNRLLKESPEPSLIAVWNRRLAETGGAIMHARHLWFAGIAEKLSDEYRAVSGTSETLALAYRPTQNLNADRIGFAAGALSRSDFTEALSALLDQRMADEIARREAFIGPHRDDFLATLDARAVGGLASQGEHRSALIALKLAQLKNFTECFGKTPLFVLDDVASELDSERCRHLFDCLRDEKAQVFITTTENNLSGDTFKGRSCAFQVAGGSVGAVT